MTTARLLVGDSRTRTADIDDGSVEMLLTSPPFLALRSYLPADHPDKGSEIGSEADPAAFLDTLLALTADWRRVLAPYGSLCVELGDTYSGSGGAGGDYNADGLREGQPKFRQARWSEYQKQDYHGGPTVEGYRKAGPGLSAMNAGPGWPLPKSLALIPTLYPACLAYGRNVLTGEPSPAGRWRIRNLLVWARPNPPVGALGDKFRPATSYVTVATMAADRWFDLDAVRTAYKPGTLAQYAATADDPIGSQRMTHNGDGTHPSSKGMPMQGLTHAGAPPLDWHDDGHDFDTALDHFLADQWQPLLDLPTAPYKGAHYATFPPELPRRLIEAMCPRQVCRVCGTPRRRIVESERIVVYPQKASTRARSLDPGFGEEGHTNRTTLGWSDCGHDDYRPGIVFDPFAGSGTTLAVATGCGRDAIGIELDPRCVDLIRQRVGMFLTEEPAA